MAPRSELHDMGCRELTQAYQKGSLSPVEVTQAALDRIDALNGTYGAYCLVDHAAALASAAQSEARWRSTTPLSPIDGIPASIKDICLTKGWPTLRGSAAVDPSGPWLEDAPCTARLIEAGAVLLGKTTTPERGWKGVTDNPLGDIARNPHDPSKTAGGSSGGAAVAASLGMGVLHIGTDGGGSIRIPAAFSGVFGIKPTFGRVPAFPASPFGDVAHVGPMARKVTDAALMLDVLSRPDRRDWTALPAADGMFADGIDGGVKGLRIGFSADLGYVQVDPEVAQSVASAADVFRSIGGESHRRGAAAGRPGGNLQRALVFGGGTITARLERCAACENRSWPCRDCSPWRRHSAYGLHPRHDCACGAGANPVDVL